MKIKTNDKVKIISGKDRGKTGKVTHAFPKEDKIVVEGVNIAKKHLKPKKQGEQGQVVQMPKPIHVSNVVAICSSCKKTTRIANGSEGSRICKKCGGNV